MADIKLFCPEQKALNQGLKAIGILYFTKIYDSWKDIPVEGLPVWALSLEKVFEIWQHFMPDSRLEPFTIEELDKILDTARERGLLVWHNRNDKIYYSMMP